MSRYRDGWMLVTAATTTVGAWLALWTWPMAAVLGVFACAAFAGSFVAALVDRESGQRRMYQVVAGGSMAGGAAVSAAGLVVLCGTPGLLVGGRSTRGFLPKALEGHPVVEIFTGTQAGIGLLAALTGAATRDRPCKGFDPRP